MVHIYFNTYYEKKVKNSMSSNSYDGSHAMIFCNIAVCLFYSIVSTRKKLEGVNAVSLPYPSIKPNWERSGN